jgi:uncharacterized protein involved in exopolysaccharide biosynthesis
MAEQVTERHEATLRDYLGIMFRQKWVILTVLAIPTIVVLAQSLGSRTLYKSTATVLLRRGQKESAMVPYVTVLPWEEQVSSEEQTATSAVVIAEAQKILDARQSQVPDKDRITIKAGSAEAGIVGESNVLAISYVDHEPTVARMVTQALTEAYIKYREQETRLAPGLLGFFDTRIEEVKAKLGELRQERETFMKEQGVNDLDRKTWTLLDMWEKLSGVLSDAVSARIVEETKIAQIKKLMTNPDVEVPILEELLGSESLISTLRKSRDSLKQDLEKMEANYTDKDQRVIALQRQLAETEDQLAREIKQAIVIAEARLAPLVAKENQLRRDVAKVEAQLTGYPEQDAVLADLDARIKTLERDYETLTSRKIDAMVSKESSPEWDIILLSPPSQPVALRTKDYVRLSLGPLLGLLVGIGLAFLFDSLDHSVKTKSEVESILGVPVVACIVDLKDWDRKLKELESKK